VATRNAPPTLTLHGFAYSDYDNLPEHVLLHKGVPFGEHLVYPSGEGYERVSPARKVPVLTTEDGRHLSEASVLREYLEDAYPERPLLPADPRARDHVRRVMRLAELPESRRVDADAEANREDFFASIASRHRGDPP
jgi:glutathione S-transferase